MSEDELPCKGLTQSDVGRIGYCRNMRAGQCCLCFMMDLRQYTTSSIAINATQRKC